MVDPREVHTREDLHAALHALHKSAGISYVKLTKHPDVTTVQATIHGWVHGKYFPQWANLAPVLWAWGVTDDELGEWKAAHERADSDARLRPGVALDQVLDPFALEVHETITVTDRSAAVVSGLPPYVRRAHDVTVAGVVEQALGGASAMVVLLGDSSTGKTRALWQALEPLRAGGGWRLWHPSPYRPEELSEQLGRLGSRTVVWLNETQRYFLPLGDQERGRLAEQLQSVLADPRRAPILVLGSLWHEHYTALCSDHGSATRRLLEPATVPVPEKFTGTDLDAMRAAAPQDPRLEMAIEKAEEGRITQYLAGGPELVHFYKNLAGPFGKAVIEAAMDLVRLGHPNALPFALLRDAASGYLDQLTWDTRENNWFEAALAETSHKCKGARGPITPTNDCQDAHAPTGGARRRARTSGSGRPVYQLADYLDQHGRRTRGQRTPPYEFWTAAARHAGPDPQNTLAHAGWDRGHYRDAAQLWKNATHRGHSAAAAALVTLPFDNPQPADWAAAHAALDDPGRVARLLKELREAGLEAQVRVLAERAAAHTALDDPGGVARLLKELREAGLEAQVRVLAERAAAHTVLDDPGGVARLLEWLREAGLEDQVRVLAERAAAHAALDPGGVAGLLEWLREAGLEDQVRVLAERAAAHAALDDSGRVAWLLKELGKTGLEDQVRVLAERAAAHAALDPGGVAWLLKELREAGLEAQVRVLAERAAAHTALDDPGRVARLLKELREAGLEAQVRVLAERAAAHTALDDPVGVAWLLHGWGEAGLEDQVRVLAERAAAHTALDDPVGVAWLLEWLREAGLEDQVRVLAERAAAHAALDDSGRVAWLLEWLREAGLEDQVRVLAERAAAHTALDDPVGVAGLLKELGEAGLEDQVRVLAERAAAHTALDVSGDVAGLLEWLREAGLEDQVRVLAERAAAHAVLDVSGDVAGLLEGFGKHATLDSPPGVAGLLKELGKAGLEDQVRVLAERAAAHAVLDDPGGVAGLLEWLGEAGLEDEVRVLAERLPGAGMFEEFLATSAEVKQRFEFGREPIDDSVLVPAERWSWSGLD
ncbi:hypothetical protein [Nocardia asteroides]|uniref:hypothetical protein n=1 Tax=Nocardia asteroides TaxID=1824 RepID=UPI001E383EA2|nr:hypothetical protein [Nocardia asteroides]UGT59132.1 hypothetical protein LTT61_17725 [Nocardia asteroides]